MKRFILLGVYVVRLRPPDTGLKILLLLSCKETCLFFLQNLLPVKSPILCDYLSKNSCVTPAPHCPSTTTTKTYLPDLQNEQKFWGMKKKKKDPKWNYKELILIKH